MLVGRPVLSADPAHFAIISNTDHYVFTKDGRTVHVNGNPVAGADPSSFRVLQGAYAQDGQHVFYFKDVITEADAASFKPLDGPYARDAGHVYWMGKTIDGADPAHLPRVERGVRVLSRSGARRLPAVGHRRCDSEYVPA